MNKCYAKNKPIPDYHRYARLKAEWETANPTATCEEYDAMIRRIAKLCGV